MNSTLPFGADLALPLWDVEPSEGAFTLQEQKEPTHINGVIKEVSRPWLFGYKSPKPNGRAVLILGGGGYVELMVGREGVAVALWLTTLGFNAFVLVHRFPTAKTGAQAPVDDARRSLRLIEDTGLATKGLGICGLSSGGHLAAALLAGYPTSWKYPNSTETTPKPTFAIIGYGPISTNAVGRTIIPDKAPLAPPEKQELYNIVQPDVQLVSPPPPTFIVYSGNDPIVPVVNAYRLSEGITKAGGVVELHVFADAPHGFGIDTPDLPVSRWPLMCEAWLEQNGILKS
ncbi:esterase/lipase [Leptodontidium sp. MPI-SDFR-AT-0119]|nr:esterase/lipase [Leptodontidium sp. MPI-SDFR-AT-0119]